MYESPNRSNICLLSTIFSNEYFSWTNGNDNSKNQVGISKANGFSKSQLNANKERAPIRDLVTRFLKDCLEFLGLFILSGSSARLFDL